MRLGGVETKEQADALRGTRLFVPRDRLPEADEDEFYHADLVNLAVVDTGGTAGEHRHEDACDGSEHGAASVLWKELTIRAERINDWEAAPNPNNH